MTSLFEISQELQAVLSAIESGDIPEEAAEDMLEGVQIELSIKAEDLACYIKERRAYAASVKYLEDEYKKRRQALESHADRLEAYLSRTMLANDIKKLECPRCVISHRASERVAIDNESLLPRDFIKLTPEPNKTAIKAAIKAGNTVHGARIEAHQNIQIK
jgi:hypothetical protein